MRAALLWMFRLAPATSFPVRLAKYAARIALFLTPAAVTRLLWEWSNGWSVCAGMVLVGIVSFIGTTWYRWNVLEAEPEPDLAPMQVHDRVVRRRRRARVSRSLRARMEHATRPFDDDACN